MFSRKPTGDPAEPPAPVLDDMEAARASMLNGFLVMQEALAPAFDAADGMRADLVARGWSPAMAEMLVATWLQRTLMNLTPLIGGPQQ
ncbi:hypothetical protein ACGF3G_00155 [Streptomyces sp. NPDC048179]|uniref:hypothetical protein n=1 Tax=Streptomyces sp. NPDC048179 TaxID=3365506 RepID=UPI003711F2E9